MGAGLQSLDSVGSDVALLEYNTYYYVIPTMLYRLCLTRNISTP